MASPGPDVVQIIRLGARSTRAAVWAAIGSTTGLMIWTVASLAGLTALISAHPEILVALQIAGGSYLLWMAFSAISSGIKERRAPATMNPQPRGSPRTASSDSARRTAWAWSAIFLIPRCSSSSVLSSPTSSIRAWA
ncbi:LysE family translocator [Corynebacterium guaraldiae]|uniref:LysE family translocator n=1 Tax=Corynebacterium guaraldiae TaxID=3051103 RepID=UPI00259D0426|nr:LysE family transporter [Corynebacterium guaraldiae]